MKREIIKEIILDFHQQALTEVKPRRLKLPINSHKVVTVSGVRRSGKTYLLYSVINKLVAKGVNITDILYLNFEDERLAQETFSFRELDIIIQSYRELYPEKDLKKCYFFFDEIQVISSWERFIRRIDDAVTKNIFISGSNALLLGNEIATSLRGRAITYEIFPLSFREYLGFMDPIIASKINYTVRDKAKIANLLDTFIFYGGFPELTQLDREIKQKTLQSYFNVMIFTDLIERYNIAQSAILKYFCKRLVGCSASEFSVHKIYNEIKSQGYKVGKDTLYQFQDYVEAVYLARFINKHSPSVIKQEFSFKKSYCIDLGLANAIDFKFSKDLSRQLENLVYLELMKSGKEVYYFKNGYECDFLIQENGVITSALQVCYDLTNDKTGKREINGLIHVCKSYKLTNGLIIARDEVGELTSDGVKVNIIPIQKFLLESGL